MNDVAGQDKSAKYTDIISTTIKSYISLAYNDLIITALNCNCLRIQFEYDRWTITCDIIY